MQNSKVKTGFTPTTKNLVWGFTMIELLVVVSIIGVLAALVMVSFTGSQKQAKDSQRKSDLRQYSTSIEAFANKNGGLYPSRTIATAAADGLCTDLDLTSCPDDPKYTANQTHSRYQYISDGSGSGTADGTEYVLWAELENVTQYWVVCSIGKIGTAAVAPSSSVCPL